jgi:hypothetical protein
MSVGCWSILTAISDGTSCYGPARTSSAIANKSRIPNTITPDVVFDNTRAKHRVSNSKRSTRITTGRILPGCKEPMEANPHSEAVVTSAVVSEDESGLASRATSHRARPAKAVGNS